jgi:hypothetical protein
MDRIFRAPIDKSGISHYIPSMPTVTAKRPKTGKKTTVLRNYDAAADARNRISLRGAKTKYFHVKALSNGGYLLEPRILMPPDEIPPRTLKMLERSVAALKTGKASAPIDLSAFDED